MTERDPLAEKWCCLSCGWTGSMGKLRIGGGTGERSPGNDHGLNCPSCRGMKIHPADGGVHDVPDYQGERGPLQ